MILLRIPYMNKIIKIIEQLKVQSHDYGLLLKTGHYTDLFDFHVTMLTINSFFSW